MIELIGGVSLILGSVILLIASVKVVVGEPVKYALATYILIMALVVIFILAFLILNKGGWL